MAERRRALLRRALLLRLEEELLDVVEVLSDERGEGERVRAGGAMQGAVPLDARRLTAGGDALTAATNSPL